MAMPFDTVPRRREAAADVGQQLTPALLARSCGFDPAAVAEGASDPRLAVAWYARQGGEPFFPRFAADPTMHMVGVQLEPQWIAARTNGRPTWRGMVPAMGIGLNRAGSSGSAEVRGPLSRLMYFLPVALVERCAEQAGLATGAAAPELVSPRYAIDPELGLLGRQTLHALRHGGPLSRLRFDALGQLLAVRMLERWSSLAPLATRFPRSAAPRAITRAVELLRANFTQSLGIHELATAAGLSDHHFCRAFRTATGQSPHQYQLSLRFDRASALLKDTELSIGDIAAMVGYDDPSHLARLFRARAGVSPTAYRASAGGLSALLPRLSRPA